MKSYPLIDALFDTLYPQSQEAKKELILFIKQHEAATVASPWYTHTPIVAMTLYVDLFSEDILSLREKLSYFKDLGINLIHLMPLLKTRKNENDGGYAVVDFNDVDERFGTKNDLLDTINYFHKHDIKLMIDFVLNHVAKEHQWSMNAMKGDVYYQNYFMMFDDAFIPSQFDLKVPLVIPERKKTNFTYVESISKYVYTSFSDYQWDLNYKNPYVLIEMLKQLYSFSMWGIDMIRLDAIPFIWKTIGTNCRNLPEVHILMRLFRAFRDLTCPNVALLGEAIVEPHEIVKYFGTDEAPECDFMYDANLMVDLWHTVATQDGRLLTLDANRFQLPKHATWLNYIRCHDDIGWGLNEEALRSQGFDPFIHKQFLISFFNGSFEGSFSKGIDYQKNEQTHDARTNGMFASLAGIEDAKDQHASMLFELSIKRIKMLNGLLFFYQGAPMIYAGDDIGMINDKSYLEDDTKKDDSRWIHRPYYDWQLYDDIMHQKDQRFEIHRDLKQLIVLRKKEHLLSPFTKQRAINIHNSDLVVLEKKHQEDGLIGIFNVTNKTTSVNLSFMKELGYRHIQKDLIQGRKILKNQSSMILAPYEILFIPVKTA